ncbi:tyrosine-type recombinase/integrase [Methanococcoides sp. AM1]|uniref:tyrosine-type recombinase/integrase n=1 Tax=Methanococcoides sp. AM1 TaxID=1201011 RepID=UPI001083D2EB|nr:tyrosine-type recombinase/integrase [Methanococcoides sp. AM1]
MRRNKVEYDFITFTSPEASDAICAYLQWRNQVPNIRGKVRDIVHEKRRIYSDDDYIFIKSDVPSKYLKTHDDVDRKLNLHGLMDIYRTLATRAGKSTPNGDWQYVRSHTMRKYFYSAMLNGGADIFFVDFLSGHTLKESQSAYYRAKTDALKKKYIKYLPFLAIEDTEVHTIESEEYRKLREQNDELGAEVARMKTLIDDGISVAVAAEVEKVMKAMNSK